MAEERLITTERIALVTAYLYEGGTVTPAFVADRIGITENGAWRMLSKLSRVLPITEEDGQWWLISRLPGRQSE
jgi:hypothetical protein